MNKTILATIAFMVLSLMACPMTMELGNVYALEEESTYEGDYDADVDLFDEEREESEERDTGVYDDEERDTGVYDYDNEGIVDSDQDAGIDDKGDEGVLDW